MTGRTTSKHTRVYMDGYDLSGYGRTIGPLIWEHDEVDLTAQMGDAVKGYLPGQPTISAGVYNGVLDNSAGAIHAIASPIAFPRKLMIPIGQRAAPTFGDPVFVTVNYQLDYTAADDGGAIVCNVSFGAWTSGSLINYDKPWGVLLHPKGAETDVNSAASGALDNGAATSTGGYMMYQVFTSSGVTHTATLSVESCDDNVPGSFAPVTGATTGSIVVKAGVSGIVALAPTTTIFRFPRWQIAFGTATSVTFALALVRG